MLLTTKFPQLMKVTFSPAVKWSASSFSIHTLLPYQTGFIPISAFCQQHITMRGSFLWVRKHTCYHSITISKTVTLIVSAFQSCHSNTTQTQYEFNNSIRVCKFSCHMLIIILHTCQVLWNIIYTIYLYSQKSVLVTNCSHKKLVKLSHIAFVSQSTESGDVNQYISRQITF